MVTVAQGKVVWAVGVTDATMTVGMRREVGSGDTGPGDTVVTRVVVTTVRVVAVTVAMVSWRG